MQILTEICNHNLSENVATDKKYIPTKIGLKF